MRVGRRVGTVFGIAVIMVLATPAVANAALAITVPTSTVTLGSAAPGSSLSQHLGTVTVTASGIVAPSFTATVSTTTFTTGAGSASETIGKASISYWSGPSTVTIGAQNQTPGQLGAGNAQTLTTSRTAFSATGVVLSITTAWNPTIVVAVPAAAVAGTYSGTITHSVA